MKMKKIYFSCISFIAVVLLCHGACSHEKADWEKACSENTVESYSTYLEKYPKSRLAESAVSKIEKIRFEEAQRDNNIDAYEEFLKIYPDGVLSQDARSRLEKLRFNEALSQNTIRAFENFINLVPHGALAIEAKKRIDDFLSGWLPQIKNARTMQIIINESFPSNVRLPYSDSLNEFTRYTGIEVIKNKSQKSDLSLKIEVIGNALGNSYRHGRIYLYSGAFMSGVISLEQNNALVCIFRLKAYSDSGSIRTAVPFQSGHRFRLIPATFSMSPESDAALDNFRKMGQDASFERRHEWPERGYPCGKYGKS